MPGITSDARTGILERFVLQPIGGDTGRSPVCEQSLAIGRDEVRESASLPNVPVQPETAVHGENHPVTPRSKFTK